MIKYGKPKYIVLFRINPSTLETKYYLFRQPPQALFVKLSVDGNGGVLLGWVDEDKMPYRIVWVYSNNFMNSYTSPQIISDKEKGIVLFEPIILNGKPYMVYVLGHKLLVRDLLNDKVLVIDELKKPIVLRVKITGLNVWIAIQDGEDLVKIYKLSHKWNKKEEFIINSLELLGKVYKLNKFLWSLYDFNVVKDKPICAITAKFKELPGVKVDNLLLPDRFNVFVSKGNLFRYVHRTKPFLVTYTFPRIITDNDSWIISYFGRRFIYGNIFISYKGISNKSDISLEPPSTETGIPDVISVNKSIYRFLYPIRKGNYVYLKLVDIDVKKVKPYYELPPKAELELMLKHRVKEFIKCQIADNLECIENFIDPVSRKIYHRKPKVKIDILDYKYSKLIILGNVPLAVCIGRIKYRIPAGTLPGINKDVIREIKTQDVWVYMNGQWYYVPPAPLVKYYLKW